MKRIIHILSGLLAVLMVLAAVSGCVLNEEKDSNSVVASIGGQEILKKDFLRYFKGMCFIYTVYGNTLPTEGDELADFKLDEFNYFVTLNAVKKEVEAAQKSINAEDVAKNADALFETAKEFYISSEAYQQGVLEFASSEDELKAVIKEIYEFAEYDSLFATLENAETGKIGAETVVTVDGVEIPRYILYYYALSEYLYNTYTGTSMPSTSQELYKQCAINIAKAQCYIAYAESRNVQITDEDIDGALSVVKFLEGLYGEEQVTSLLSAYYITDEQYKEAQKFMGKGIAAENAVVDSIKETLNPTDEELNKYFTDNYADYDESEVGAYHILTKDESLANQIFSESGGTADGFMKVYEKYKNNENVTQAVDLGTFGRGEMVSDFETGVFAMKKGEVKTIKTASFGYHVVYVYSSNQKDVSFEDVKDQVRQDYIDTNAEEEADQKLAEIYSGAKKKEGDYQKTPGELFKEYLYEKYDIKTYEKVVKR